MCHNSSFPLIVSIAIVITAIDRFIGPSFAQYAHPQFTSPTRQAQRPNEQVKDPNAELESLGLTPFIMGHCIDNLRTWFVTQLLKPTLAQIEHLNAV